MVPQKRIRNRRARTEHGQALIETMLVVPFFILLMMILAEFGIYFYRCNLLENTVQHMGRMAARRATFTEIETYMNTKLSALSPELTVEDESDVSVSSWTSDDEIEITLSATLTPLMPIGVLNIFAPAGTEFFPSSFTIQSRKAVFVE